MYWFDQGELEEVEELERNLLFGHTDGGEWDHSLPFFKNNIAQNAGSMMVFDPLPTSSSNSMHCQYVQQQQQPSMSLRPIKLEFSPNQQQQQGFEQEPQYNQFCPPSAPAMSHNIIYGASFSNQIKLEGTDPLQQTIQQHPIVSTNSFALAPHGTMYHNEIPTTMAQQVRPTSREAFSPSPIKVENSPVKVERANSPVSMPHKEGGFQYAR
jgi:hypothetical protein